MLTFIAITAYAQQEACQPRPASEFTAALDAAVSLLGTSDAGKALDTAQTVARCLSTPIDRDALASFAWARAEHASYDQDLEQAWGWIALATDAGHASPPQRLPAVHPLRMIVREMPEPSPEGGPDGVELAPPKKGSVYADGVVLAEPRLRLGTPHLVQVFDKDAAIYTSQWQMGPDFPMLMLAPKVATETRPVSDAHDALPPANWKPVKNGGKEEDYQEWVKKNPKGPWLQEALDAIDELNWQKAKKTGTDLAWRQYIHDFPKGLHLDEARFLVEHQAYTTLLEKPSSKNWVEFLGRFPEGSYATEAKLQIELIEWRAAQSVNTPEAFLAFYEKNPSSRYASRAKVLEEERFFDRAYRTNSETKLVAYQKRWPEGSFVEEAKAMLGGVQLTGVTIAIDDGEIPEGAKALIREALVAEFTKRSLPVVEAPGPGIGQVVVQADSGKEGRWLRLRGTLELRFGTLKRPLVHVPIDTQIAPDVVVGTQLGELFAGALPPLDTWYKAPPKP